MILTEGDLSFTFNGALSAVKFDDGTAHGLTHCMKAVDFVVEFQNYYVFVEVKDPYHPNAQSQAVQAFSAKLQSGELCNDLVAKYRDSFLYRWAEEKVDKPVNYFILLSMSFLSSTALMQQGHNLRAKLPLKQSQRWTKPIVAACAMFNIHSWNQQLAQWPVRRISAITATGV